MTEYSDIGCKQIAYITHNYDIQTHILSKHQSHKR